MAENSPQPLWLFPFQMALNSMEDINGGYVLTTSDTWEPILQVEAHLVAFSMDLHVFF